MEKKNLLIMSVFSFGFKGLPFCPDRYKFDGQSKYYIRRKIKRKFSTIGTIKKLYINEIKCFGRVLIELDTDSQIKLMKIISAINNSPLRMLKFSWEQPILNMKTENQQLLPYKSWLFLEFYNSYEKTLEILTFLEKNQEMLAVMEFNNFLKEKEFEDSCEEWLLEQQIKELEIV